LFFGKITAVVEAAQGAGIVSSVILQSDDLDEIDLEWLGGDTTEVQSNYFSKGNTSSYNRGGTHPVSNPQTTFHSISFQMRF
jgi:beta-glucanase (GH16 family)